MKRSVTALILMTSALFAGANSTLGAAAARQLTKGEVKEFALAARTSEDHLRLAAYFTAKADRLGENAIEHKRMADSYRGRDLAIAAKRPMSGGTSAHCDYF